MFVGHELVLDVSFQAAQTRLANLACENGLCDASEDAYRHGLETTIRVGPFGAIPGVSKQVRIRCLEPVCREGTMTVGLRWEAMGVTGGLFPVLDADIYLTPAGERTTLLSLAGAYRPPLGVLGASLDKVLLHQVATATIRALLHNLASTLAGPAAAEG